jgi:rare lipoprotein A
MIREDSHRQSVLCPVQVDARRQGGPRRSEKLWSFVPMRLRQTIGFSLALLVMSGGTMTGAAAADPHEQHRHSAKKPAARHAVRHAAAHRREHARRHAARGPEDRDVGPVHAIGAREVGTAAWYGGRHLGRRTASGETLDAVHATAAHRTLPLNSLARVTNLNNGRSTVVRITDRGPASRDFLIDLSPAAADALDMKRAGIAPVSIEPVATVADAAE